MREDHAPLDTTPSGPPPIGSISAPQNQRGVLAGCMTATRAGVRRWPGHRVELAPPVGAERACISGCQILSVWVAVPLGCLMSRWDDGPVRAALDRLGQSLLLTEPRGRLRADGYAPGAVDNQTTWNATKATLEVRQVELAAGLLQAPGATADPPEPALLGATLQLAPPCRYCSYGALCGRGGET